MHISELSIGKRLGISFGALAVIALLLGGLAVFGTRTLSENMENIGGNRVPALQALAQLNRERMVIRAQTQAVFAHETQANIREKLRGIQEERRKSWQQVDQGWETLLKIPRTSEKGRVLQQQLGERYKAWRAIYVDLDDLIERLASAANASQTTTLYAEYRQVVSRMAPISDAMGKIFDAMTENNFTRTNEMIKVDRATAAWLEIWVIAATAFSVILAVLLGWFITRSVVAPLKRGGEMLDVFAEGDMTREVPVDLVARKDEIGDLARAMKAMATQLRKIVSNVTQTTAQVSSAAAEIAQGSSDLAQRTEEQASALEQTASSMEELTSTVKQSADNAGQANQLASAARAQAEQGGQVVDQAITAMSAINQSSRKIADIIGVIDEIAFQTNLLALNAAVEAARAGEQGRGFAVVAGEVRKLAQRSADAAKEIKSLITDSVNKVEDGGQLVERSGHTLKEIVTSIKKVSDIVAEIAAASREQASGIEQVNKAILQMDQVTQQNAALVEQTAAASHAMGDQARELQGMMSFFKLDKTVLTPAAHPRTVERSGFKREKTQPISKLSAGSKVGSAGGQAVLLTWNDALSVADPDIDKQHRKLIDMINDLHNAMLKGQTQSAMGNLFNRLIEYTVEHFSYEEERMEACRYPNIIEHKAKHADLVQQATELQEKFNSGSQHLNMKVMRFLKDWITNHIQKSDKHYMPYLQAKR